MIEDWRDRHPGLGGKWKSPCEERRRTGCHFESHEPSIPYDNPGIGGIDLQWAMQCKLENVFVNTGVYSVQASRPTHGARGLITPACNNAMCSP